MGDVEREVLGMIARKNDGPYRRWRKQKTQPPDCPDIAMEKWEEAMCFPEPCEGCGRMTRWHDGQMKHFRCFSFPGCRRLAA